MPGTCSARVASRICSIASESATPGATSKENVTDGSWPWCVTMSGPTPYESLATALSGTSVPVEERTYNIESASGVAW